MSLPAVLFCEPPNLESIYDIQATAQITENHSTTYEISTIIYF